MYGHLIGPNKAHAIILRGDTTGNGVNYSVSAGSSTAFVEYGGTWRFRQIQDTFNTLCFEITSSYVNIPTNLRVGDVDINSIYQKRPWVSGLVKIVGNNVSVVNQRGQKTASANFSSNMFNITWTTPHPDGDAYIAQYSLFGSVGMIYQVNDSSAVTGMSIVTTTITGTAFGKDFYPTLF